MTAALPHLTTLQCPDVLRDLKAWVCWRREGGRKVPFYASGGRRHGVQGTDADRARLVKFTEARTAAIAGGHDGVGFCPLSGLGIAALDFDGCIDDAGNLHPDVERIVAGTYAERSPSGRGVRAFLRGNLGDRKNHGEPFGFEVFSTKGYVTVTGDVLPVVEMTDAVNTIANVTPDVIALCEARFGRAQGGSEPAAIEVQPLGVPAQQLRDMLAPLDPDMGYDQWLRFGMAVHHETSGEGFDIWDEWSSKGSKYPGRDQLEAKWDSFGRGSQSPTTVHALVRAANQAGSRIDIAHLESADDFDVVGPAAAVKPPRFKVYSHAEFLARKPPGWIVKGLIPQAEIAMVIGEPGAGKSFMALELAAAIARGAPFLGHKSAQGAVLYIAAEGSGGFRNRYDAYCKSRGVTDMPFTIMDAAPNLLLHEDALEVVRIAKSLGPLALIVVDTAAATTPGADENSAKDMGRVIEHCKTIAHTTKALVVLIHHTGKDKSKGARGWSGLKGAADAEIEITRSAAGRVLRVSKQKDGEDGQQFWFALDVVQIDVDEDGDAITSCVVREVAAPVISQIDQGVQRKARPRGAWQGAIYDAVAACGDIGIGLTESELIDAVSGVIPPEGDRDRRPERVRAALTTLTEKGTLELVGERYTLGRLT